MQPQLNISCVGYLFFKKFVVDVIIPATNVAMEKRGNMLAYSEFLVFLRIWFLMAAIIGPSRKEWFLSLPIDQFDGLGQQFEQILTALRFTSKEKPNYVHRYWEV